MPNCNHIVSYLNKPATNLLQLLILHCNTSMHRWKDYSGMPPYFVIKDLFITIIPSKQITLMITMKL